MLPESNPEIYRAVLESLPMGVYLVDRSRQISFWNAEAERITGYLAQEVIGRLCHQNLLMHCDENQRILCGCACPLAESMQDGRPREVHVFLRHKEGQRVPVRVRAMPIRDEFGAVIGSAEYFEEWSPQPAGLSPARTGDSLDEVTGVPDRQAMQAIVQARLEAFAASPTPFGLLCVAIDGLDHLRHVRGWQAATAVLRAAAQTLSGDVRPGDLVGRWEEEGLAALIGCSNAGQLHSCAQRLRRLVSLAGIPWWGDRLSVTISIGGTMARGGDTPELLFARAREALATAQAVAGDSVLVA